MNRLDLNGRSRQSHAGNVRQFAPLADRFHVMEHGQIAESFAAAQLQSKMRVLHELLGV